MADTNFFPRFRDVYRDIDRSLDARDRKGFGLASRELRKLATCLRDLIDNVSVADITATGAPHTRGAGRAP